MDIPHITLPLFFTLTRLILAPIVMPFLCWYYLADASALQARIFVLFIFILFSFTDYLDGYLARKYNQVSVVGKLLDPIADKCFILATAVSLVYVQPDTFVLAIIFLIRELYVMGLREIALFYGFSVDVQAAGKIKMFLQSIYLMLLIAGAPYWLVLCIAIPAAYFTVYSAYVYTISFFDQWKKV